MPSRDTNAAPDTSLPKHSIHTKPSASIRRNAAIHSYTSKTIDRVDLDDAFFRLARSSGIGIEEKTEAVAVDPDNKLLTVRDPSGNDSQISFDFLVFADGTGGISAALQKKRKVKRRNIAIQLIFKSELQDGISVRRSAGTCGSAATAASRTWG